MAELYLAKDTRGNRMVVLKRILPYLAEEAEFLKMFLDEARIAAQLHHPNIVEVYELGRLDGTTFISMEWVDGIDLRKVLQREQERDAPIPPGVGAWVIGRLCEGLFHAHTREGPDGRPLGIIHRDVSPQNVMVSYRGDVKLVDFGIAKATAWMSRSKPGVIKGKFLYLAPEQLTQDRLDHRADLFAVGTLLYELTVGKSPFHRPSTEAVIYSIRMEEPVPPSTVIPGYPAALARVVMKCLEKDREKRYQTADEVRAALDAFIQVEAPTTKDDVVRYMAEIFGDDDERTSVYVPPNAQSQAKAKPVLAAKPPPPIGEGPDDDRTVSIPGAPRPGDKPPPPIARPGDDPSTDPDRPKGRDVLATAPIISPPLSKPKLPPIEPSFEPERTNVGPMESHPEPPDEPTNVRPVGRSEPTLAIAPPGSSDPELDFGPTRISSSQAIEIRTGDVVALLESGESSIEAVPSETTSTLTQERDAPLLVDRPKLRPTQAPSEATLPPARAGNDETRNELEEVQPKPPPPQRSSRPRRPTGQQPKREGTSKGFDLDDHIATLDMAKYEDSQAVQLRQNRNLAAVAILTAVGVAVLALLIWALWPSKPSAPVPKGKPGVEKPATKSQPPPPASAITAVKVTFRAPAGTKASIEGNSLTLGSPVELPPGAVTIRYTCPAKKKQRPRTVEFTSQVPASPEPVAIDLSCW